MKKLAVTLCLTAMATAAFAQGTVNFINSSTTFVRTNAIASPSQGGTAGNTAAGLGGFVYGVFTAPSTVSSLSGSLQELLSPTWTFTGLYGTNIAASSGGRLSGGSNIGTQQGWAPGSTNSFAVVGWSVNLGGLNWGAVSNLLSGATLSGGAWSGGGFTGASITGNAFLGASSVGFGAAGGGTAGLPAFSLFGAAPTASGTPITSGFDLFVVAVPEPTSFALLGLGTAAMVIFRRRK
jgi:hypothetical protein